MVPAPHLSLRPLLAPPPPGPRLGALEAERLEELPLCSCRMEAPKIERLSQGGRSLCMATESVDGQVGGAWGRGRGLR